MTGDARDQSVAMTTTTALKDIGLKIVSDLQRHNVAAVPECYEVWFHYLQGSIKSLSDAIDEKLRKSEEIDTAFVKSLYYRFCGLEHIQSAFDKHYEGIITEVHGLQNVAQNLSASAGSFGEEVRTISDQAKGADSSVEVARLVGRLVEASAKAAARNAELEAELEAASNKISTLHDSIKEIEQDAHTDFLTKLFNRRRFDKLINEAHLTAQRDGTPLSLIMCDVDHFKRFNDTYGHPVGDQVLKFFGGVLKSNTKGQDLCARYGGEEFAILLPNTSAKNAEAVAEQIRAVIARRKLISRTTNEDLGTVTMSFGVTELRTGLSVEALFEAADSALYEAKRTGRNKVVTHEARALRAIA